MQREQKINLIQKQTTVHEGKIIIRLTEKHPRLCQINNKHHPHNPVAQPQTSTSSHTPPQNQTKQLPPPTHQNGHI